MRFKNKDSYEMSQRKMLEKLEDENRRLTESIKRLKEDINCKKETIKLQDKLLDNTEEINELRKLIIEDYKAIVEEDKKIDAFQRSKISTMLATIRIIRQVLQAQVDHEYGMIEESPRFQNKTEICEFCIEALDSILDNSSKEDNLSLEDELRNPSFSDESID